MTYAVDCPRRPGRTVVSSDAALFAQIRRRSRVGTPTGIPFAPRRLFHLLPITDACNLRCPICYAEAAPENARFLSVGEVRAVGKRIRDDGGRWVTLTGGEPTLHPQLAEIVRLLRAEFGLSPLVVTNGLRIAEDPAFLPALKRAGLRKVQLQFDSLDDDTYRRMRGRPLVREKCCAVERVRAAGLRLGLVVTVCDLNLAEVGRLFDFAVAQAPPLSTLIFQAGIRAGRYPSDAGIVDREAILHALVDGRGPHDLRLDDFFPAVQFAPWRLAAHPDCSAGMFVCTGRRGAHALSRDVEIERLYGRLRNIRAGGVLGSFVVPFVALLRCARRGQRGLLLRRLRSLATGRGREGMFLMNVGSYMNAETRDDGRLALCNAFEVTASSIKSICECCCEGATAALRGEGKLP